MQKPLVIGATTLTLLFGGAGVANAATYDAPATTTTTVAQSDGDDDNDDNGLWGLAGLIGLAGLLGLKRRKDTDHLHNTGTITNQPPRA